jgi:asparagine synthase (glutamine-hydrolysing)
MHKLAEVLTSKDPRSVYLRFVSHWMRPATLVLGGTEPATDLNTPGGPEDLDTFTEEMMALDVRNYLPDDILVKVDRASMAVSLETRAPLLDHRVVEFAASVPLSQKLRGSTGKWIVRQVLDKYVPRHLIERPKMGFGIPIDSWLRGPLKEWAGDLLDESRLRREGLIDPKPIRTLWEQHQTGLRQGHFLLWDVIMFEAWMHEMRGQLALEAA